MNLPTEAEVLDFIGKVETTVASLSKGAVAAAGGVEALLPVAGNIITALAPDLTIAGLPVTKVLGIASGLLNGAPDLQNAFDAVKAAATGGAAPTAEEWAALDAAADAAHADLQAAIAAYAAGQ